MTAVEILLGGLVVCAVLAFVILPLWRTPAPSREVREAMDTSLERAEIYRELLELELDQKAGKIDAADYQEMSESMLARAATLISTEDADSLASDAEVEREIAAAREALRRNAVTPAPAPPAEESRA